MGRFQRVRLAAFLLLLLFGKAMFAASSDQQHWMQVQSTHFVIITDSDVKHAREVLYRFEQMRYVFGAVMQKSAINLPVPLQIIGFRSHAELLQYAPLYQGKPVEMSGFFEASPDRDYIALDLSTDNWTTALHEYIHALVKANFPPVPTWFSEGLAEYFATLKISNQGLEVGSISENNRIALTNIQWMPLDELLLVQNDSNSYNTHNRRAIFYAESWLLVHSLISKQRLPDLFKYLQLTQIQQVSVADAMQQAFGGTPDAMQKSLHDYFNAPLHVEQFQPLVLDFSGFPFNKVDIATGNAVVADLHAHSRDYRQQAVGELQEVLRSDPDNIVANRALAWIYLQNGDLNNAADCISRARSAAPKDAEPHYLAAYYMRAQAQQERPGSSVPIEREAKSAIAAYPSYADAYAILAYAQALEQRYPEAIASAQKAVQLYPGNEDYALDLAQYYADSGDFDKSTAVLMRVKNSPDPQMVTAANQKLADIQAHQSQYLQDKHAASMMSGHYKGDLTSPQWKAAPGEKVASLDDLNDAANQQQQAAPTVRPTKYIYAELLSVNCSAPPQATLTFTANGKRMQLVAPDVKSLIVIGEDQEFSCDWKNRRVLVNYKPGGKLDGELVSLELK